MGVPENCVFVSLRRQQILAGKSLPPDALVPREKQRTLSADFSNLSSEEKTLPCLSWSTASSWDQQPAPDSPGHYKATQIRHPGPLIMLEHV